ncbi:MAG: lipopolysaccharide heptosyltransferase II [Candidatus Omnitrophica bacterium]|nr:lipopolysaccharide heptosyltransferase II [Candidatus Omnitrophota bacterium]
MQAKRILIFNVNWLGDVLFSTAVIRNIRRNFPDSFIASVVPSRCYQILKDNPQLDEIIIFDERDRHRGTLAKLNFVKLLKSKRFDTVFLLHRSFSRALISRLAGIPQRFGYYTKKRGFLLTRKIKAPKANSLHRIDYYLNIIEKAGLRVEDRYTEFFIREDDTEFVKKFLNQQGIAKDDFLVVISPAGNWLEKRWPKEYWADLAERLASEFKAKVLITGAEQDIKLAQEIQGLMKSRLYLGCGRLNLKQLGALAKRADLFISADTGPLHIANAVGAKKIIALFGPTSLDITGPYPGDNVVILQKDVGCKIPCYLVNCKDNRCMKAISVEEVIEKVKLHKVP